MPTLPELTNPAAPPPTWRIPLQLLDANPHQPRRELDEGPLSELMGSIRDHGLLQPITVRRIPGGRYQVIAGHRRLESFRRLFAEASAKGDGSAQRFATVPAHEKFDVSDEEMALFALVENLQRDDLSPLDAAIGLARFQEAHQLSTDALCKRTGMELDRVKRLLRLARAPKMVQDACHHGVLVEQVDDRGATKVLPSGSPKHERRRLDLMAALEFAKLHASAAKAAPKKADDRTGRAIQRALEERWSFRRVQAFCRGAPNGADNPNGRSAPNAVTPSLPLFTDGPELRIRRGHLSDAGPGERAALAQVLQALLTELAA